MSLQKRRALRKSRLANKELINEVLPGLSGEDGPNGGPSTSMCMKLAALVQTGEAGISCRKLTLERANADAEHG